MFNSASLSNYSTVPTPYIDESLQPKENYQKWDNTKSCRIDIDKLIKTNELNKVFSTEISEKLVNENLSLDENFKIYMTIDSAGVALSNAIVSPHEYVIPFFFDEYDFPGQNAYVKIKELLEDICKNINKSLEIYVCDNHVVVFNFKEKSEGLFTNEAIHEEWALNEYYTSKELEKLRCALTESLLTEDKKDFKIFVIPKENGVRLRKKLETRGFDINFENHVETSILLAKSFIRGDSFKIELVVRDPTATFKRQHAETVYFENSNKDDVLTNANINLILKRLFYFYNKRADCF